MKIIDITLPIHEKMANFPGTPSPKFTQIRKIEEDRKNIWSFEMTTITGTHLEAPLHSVPGGVGVDKLDLNLCIGPCIVVDVPGKDDLVRRYRALEEAVSAAKGGSAGAPGKDPR